MLGTGSSGIKCGNRHPRAWWEEVFSCGERASAVTFSRGGLAWSVALNRLAWGASTWSLSAGAWVTVRLCGRSCVGGWGCLRGHSTLPCSRVALKALPWGIRRTGNGLGRFRRDAPATAKLHHIDIVAADALGEEEGTCLTNLKKEQQ